MYLFVDLTFQFFIQISYFIRRNSSRNRLLERGVIAFELSCWCGEFEVVFRE